MTKLISSQDKLQQLCEILQDQALEPARLEAHKMIEKARHEADTLVKEAREQVKRLHEQAASEIEREKELAHASLKQAASQAVGKLRQEIENELVNQEIAHLTHQTLKDTDLVTFLIKKYIEMVEAKGWDKDFSVEISKLPEAKKLSESIIAACAGKLKEGQVLPVLAEGGFRLKLHNKRLSLEATESALIELLGQFLRKEIRTRLFM